MTGRSRTLRCAVYTRKSSEEGLEQEFNSLDAQREACEAYIKSQRHEGWTLVPTRYDDGGFSGGSLERPAVQRLLADIAARRIDVVVVYKVDRLTRSLADFARMVEAFDGAGVSFVSVTQQFNTTSSMGRLTLNVLLSFAQFEREVTGERIRDKIAASKRKGLWMGGRPTLGYRPNGRTLEIEPAEAETVRTLFALYLELGSVRLLKAEADRRGVVSKRWTTPEGRSSGGLSMYRGALYHLLSNPIYIGCIRHRGATHPGQHPAIIDQALWERVQAQLAAGTRGRRRRVTGQSMLVGKLFDAQGNRLTPSHAQKDGKRYRYYVTPPDGGAASSGWRLPAEEIEALVVRTITGALDEPREILERFGVAKGGAAAYRRTLDTIAALRSITVGGDGDAIAATVAALVERVTIDRERIVVRLRAEGLAERLGLASPDLSDDPDDRPIDLTAPIEMRRRGVEMRFIIPSEPDRRSARIEPALVKAVARGHLWFEELATGAASSIAEIAAREGVTPRYVSRLLPLAFLSPEIVERILDGYQPVELTAEALTRGDGVSCSWTEQRQRLRI